MQIRYDIEDTHDISLEISNKLFEYICLIDNVKTIVISDYNKGLITEELCQKIITYSNNNNILTL